MDTDEMKKIFSGLVRIGTVMSVDIVNHKARVKFKNAGITSGWLHVLDNRPFIPDYAGQQRTESTSGGSGEAAFSSHYHALTIKQWMPVVNQTVVCLYLPTWNGDGFVIGGLS